MPNAYILLANIRVEEQKYEEAIALYEKAAVIKPDDRKLTLSSEIHITCWASLKKR